MISFRYHSARFLAALLVGVATPVVALAGEPALAAEEFAVHGDSCPDIMVVAARGSSEAPQGTGAGGWQSASSYQDAATFYGVGQTNFALYQGLVAAKPYQRVALDSVIYPADAVPSDLTNDGPKYLASVTAGAAAVEKEIARVEAACNARVHYVFSGYSQGAWVLHKALWKLAQGSPGVLERVAGVTFFGDPEFEPQAEIVRDHKLETAIWQGAATVIDPAARSVPAMLKPRTGSYCLPGDPVCQTFGPGGGINLYAFAACTAANWQPGACPHTSYASTDQVTKAAAFLDSVIPDEYTKTVTTTVSGEQASCTTGKTWQFSIDGVGPAAGRNAPASIAARRANGSTATVKRTSLSGSVAGFETTSAVKFTGAARAAVNRSWNPATSRFALDSGPCAATKLTFTSALPAVAIAGKPITLTGKLTGKNGRALAGRDIRVWWHSMRRDGKGAEMGPYRTDSRGMFRVVVSADDLGWHDFTPKHPESGPTQWGDFASQGATRVVWVLPAAVPAGSPLTSSNGTTFTDTKRRTTVVGSGFSPNSEVGIAVYPGRKLLATAKADEQGMMSATVRIPAGLLGKHTLIAIGRTVHDDRIVAHTLTLPITVRR
ncbi:cutinase family protein [Actinoplanes sp. NPDC051859]|uniref:cutinase family protein n=1 Tax=Actinoplanes sp. NPDC051859 TaxID=3363909 RepID=UPI0037BA5585